MNDYTSTNTTNSTQSKYWCRYTNKLCEYASDFGYCRITACIKPNFVYNIDLVDEDGCELLNEKK